MHFCKVAQQLQKLQFCISQQDIQIYSTQLPLAMISQPQQELGPKQIFFHQNN